MVSESELLNAIADAKKMAQDEIDAGELEKNELDDRTLEILKHWEETDSEFKGIVKIYNKKTTKKPKRPKKSTTKKPKQDERVLQAFPDEWLKTFAEQNKMDVNTLIPYYWEAYDQHDYIDDEEKRVRYSLIATGGNVVVNMRQQSNFSFRTVYATGKMVRETRQLVQREGAEEGVKDEQIVRKFWSEAWGIFTKIEDDGSRTTHAGTIKVYPDTEKEEQAEALGEVKSFHEYHAELDTRTPDNKFFSLSIDKPIAFDGEEIEDRTALYEEFVEALKEAKLIKSFTDVKKAEQYAEIFLPCRVGKLGKIKVNKFTNRNESSIQVTPDEVTFDMEPRWISFRDDVNEPFKAKPGQSVIIACQVSVASAKAKNPGTRYLNGKFIVPYSNFLGEVTGKLAHYPEE